MNVEFSPAPYFDLDEELHLQQLVSLLIKKGFIESAHDISEGGLITTLLESSFNQQLGFDIKTTNAIRKDAFLFGESQSRVVVSVSEKDKKNVIRLAGEFGIDCNLLGQVTNGDILVDDESWGDVSDWKHIYDTSIERILSRELVSEGALGML